MSPLRIIHASTDGNVVKVDTKLGKWKYWGRLTDVDYTDQTTTNQNNKEESAMTGTLRTNVTLNIRSGMGTNYKAVGRITKGTTVEYTGNVDDGWVAISHNGVTGYICTDKNYVAVVTAMQEETADEAPASTVIITDSEGNTFQPVGDFTVQVVTD